MVTRISAQASAEQRLSELDIALAPAPAPFGACGNIAVETTLV